MKKLFNIAAITSLTLFLSACGSLANDETIWNIQREVADVADFSSINFLPGQFDGIGTGGFYGNIHVRLTIDDDGQIADIEITYSNETDSFADRAFNELIPAVLAAQSPNVDVTSGATLTSRAFLNAVLDALMHAADGEFDIEIPMPDDVTYSPARELFDMPDKPLLAGYWYGLGTGGFKGDVIARITVSEDGIIESMKIAYHQETDSFAQRVESNLIPLALEAQTQAPNLDTISGATATSTAFKNALYDAILNAMNNTPFVPEITPEDFYDYDEYDYYVEPEEVEEIEELETVEEALLASEEPAPTVASETPAEAPATQPSFAGGTFRGTGSGGFKGDITVDVTLDANRNITAVSVVSHNETPAFSDDWAFPELIPAVVGRNNADISVVSGATMTSRAFLAAVRDAISNAQ